MFANKLAVMVYSVFAYIIEQATAFSSHSFAPFGPDWANCPYFCEAEDDCAACDAAVRMHGCFAQCMTDLWATTPSMGCHVICGGR
eukprot:CAMPEP_0119356972 /NCGR_PEP_ID=MMETSP1334-20130426/5457_1 /TAXON_ID=127549 /ORGANISM="Calcidiscus leptoporus, Strain RCC1130" /LENGTH=85 /DNA_ID=CAMNT_0007371113 /DNA_START=30 /DNA_END=287 /DNA_ORIENTATION=-